MYIRTPKRYRGMQRRSAFSCQRFLLVGILMLLIIAGIGIYEMREMVRPQVSVAVQSGVQQADAWRQTQFAPTAAPTRNPSSVLIDADNEWRSGRIDFALNSYTQVVNLVPNDANVYTRLTEGYLTRGNIEEAFDYADSTVTADPFSADAWATRSLVHSWEGDFAEGVASAQQALALDPDNARATAYLAYAYFRADPQQSNLASSRAEDAIQLDPDHWSGYWVRGLVRENVLPIDLVGAQSDFETAYNLAQNQNAAMAGVAGSALARVVSSLGDDQRSVELLNEMLTIDNTNRELLYYLGIIHYRQLGQWGQAQDPFTDCVEVAPRDVNCWYMLGRTINTLGDQEGALVAFQEAIDLDTPYARHYWWLANTERNLGSCGAATPYLETGYDMAIEGGLPAVDEGDAQLISDFEAELATCGIRILPNQAPAQPTPAPTAATGDA